MDMLIDLICFVVGFGGGGAFVAAITKPSAQKDFRDLEEENVYLAVRNKELAAGIRVVLMQIRNKCDWNVELLEQDIFGRIIPNGKRG